VLALNLLPGLRRLRVKLLVARQLCDRLAVDRSRVRELDVVTLGGGPRGRLEVGPLRAQPLDHLADLGVGHVRGRDLGGQIRVGGQRELGAHVEGQRDGRGGAGLDLTLLDLDHVHDLQLLLLLRGLVGLADDLLLELGGHFLAEALEHHRRGRLARPESRDPRQLGNLPRHPGKLGVNLGRVERDDDGFAGGGQVIELDVHGKGGR